VIDNCVCVHQLVGERRDRWRRSEQASEPPGIALHLRQHHCTPSRTVQLHRTVLPHRAWIKPVTPGA